MQNIEQSVDRLVAAYRMNEENGAFHLSCILNEPVITKAQATYIISEACVQLVDENATFQVLQKHLKRLC